VVEPLFAVLGIDDLPVAVEDRERLLVLEYAYPVLSQQRAG
jgi:hypothetical protein